MALFLIFPQAIFLPPWKASLDLFGKTDPLVGAVFALLLLASLLSWTLILYQRDRLRRAWREADRFEVRFREQQDLRGLYLALLRGETGGMAGIFVRCWQQFERLSGRPLEVVERGVERAGRAEIERAIWPLERFLPWLATAGSTAPYVGLFGTVWGVVASLHPLGTIERVTFQMVAPGIAEALVATALGLLVAIPATVAYNRYAARLELLERRYRAFLDLLIARLMEGHLEAHHATFRHR